MEEIEKVISELLPSSAKFALPAIMVKLDEKGVEELEDLKHINFQLVLDGVLKEVPASKLKNRIDAFFSAGESKCSSKENKSSCKELSTLTPSTSSDWAENFYFPVERLPKVMKNKLEQNKRLTPSEYREFIRILISSVLELHEKPLKRHLSVVAKKIIDEFPIMKEFIDDQVVGSGYDGMLRKMIARVENISRITAESKEKKTAEKKAAKRSYGCSNFYPEEGDIEENEKKRKILQSEYELLSWNCENVDVLMKETFPSQRKSIINISSIEKVKLDWPFLFISRYSFSHFKLLMDMDLVLEMDRIITKKNPELYEFFKSQESEPHISLTDPYRYLEALANYFSEDFTSIIRIFEDNSIKEVVRNESTPVSPYIAAFGDPYKGEACCMLLIERVEASEFLTLKDASALCFASFYIFGLEYPEGCPATAEFVQRAFLGINPEKGTKNKKRSRRTNVNAKVSRIVEKLCNFKSMWNM